MINFEKFTLSNGLKVIVNSNTDSPIATVNLAYNIGSKDENPNKTGFAHLFEHLMFSGSANISDFDNALEKAGGNNNAFTTPDYTNFYDTLPKDNIETAFWLESDRMKQLAFSEKSLNTQKNVVIEEFKEEYLNTPYGDSLLLIHPLAYKVHPYRWTTIGKEIKHIENATLDDVKDFFYKYYAPNNAVLCVSGDFKPEYIQRISEKWFGDIERRNIPIRSLPQEPHQEEARRLTVERNVPYDAIVKAYHVEGRNTKEYYANEALSNILSNGESAILKKELIRKQELFTDLYAVQNHTLDNGLFVFMGLLRDGVKLEDAEKAIDIEVEKLTQKPISQYNIEKLQNNQEHNLAMDNEKMLDRAIALSYFELWDSADRINREPELHNSVTPEDIRSQAEKIFRPENSSTLYYVAKK